MYWICTTDSIATKLVHNISMAIQLMSHLVVKMLKLQVKFKNNVGLITSECYVSKNISVILFVLMWVSVLTSITIELHGVDNIVRRQQCKVDKRYYLNCT